MGKWSFVSAVPSFLSYICRFSLCTRWPSDLIFFFLCFLLVDGQERSRLVEWRWRSWVRNLILLNLYLNFLPHPTLPINTTWWHWGSWPGGRRGLSPPAASGFESSCARLSPPRCLTCPLGLQGVQWAVGLVVVRASWPGHPRK